MSRRAFITRHRLVLASTAKNPGNKAREIGDDVGVTGRTPHKIFNDLEEDAGSTEIKVGTRDTCGIQPGVPIKTGGAAVGDPLTVPGRKQPEKHRAEPRS